MDADKPEKFKINLEKNEAGTNDLPLDAGILDIQRSGMPSFSHIIVFIVILALIFFVYLNLAARINAITKAGETRIKTVSTGVGDRLETLSKKMAGIKNEFEKRLSTIEDRIKENKKSVNLLSKKISGITKAIDKTANTIARERKKNSDIKSYLENIKAVNKKSLAGIEKHLKTIDDSIGEISALTDKISDIKEQLADLAEQVKDLSATSADKDQMRTAIDAAIAAMNETIARRIDRAETLHARKLSAIRSEISDIKRAVSTAKRPKTASPAQDVLTRNPAPTTPDRIMEQEIK